MPASVLWLFLAVAALLAAGRWALHRGFRAPREVETTDPGFFGLDFAEIRIPTVNGKHLFGWLLAAETTAPAVVVMHGWGANAQSLLPLSAPLRRAGFTVLLVDARSHGRSDGDTFSSMPRFAEDIDAAVDWLRRSAPVRPAAIALLGHSVGGAAALLAASRRTGIAAIISLSAFDHPRRVMQVYLERMHLGWPPLVRLICRYVEHVIGHRFDDIAPVATIARITCPVLIGHGADDTLVSPEAARAIHACCPHAKLAILAGTSHEDVPDFDALGRDLAAFLSPVLHADHVTVDRT